MKENLRKIGGRQYKIVRYGTADQLRLLPDVLRFSAGPVAVLTAAAKRAGAGELGKLIAKHQAAKKDKDQNAPTLKDIPVSAVLDLLDPAALSKLMLDFAVTLEESGLSFFDELLANTFVVGGRSDLDDKLRPVTSCISELFDDNLWNMFVLSAHVIHINFAPFLRLPDAK